jgi:hypothetical protein
MTNACAKYSLQAVLFPLYSPLTASGALARLLRDLGGFFVARNDPDAWRLLFDENAHD